MSARLSEEQRESRRARRLLCRIAELAAAWEAVEAQERPQSATATFPLPARQAAYAKTVAQALAAIDRVHRYAELPQVPIRFSAGTVVTGSLHLVGPLPVKVTLSVKERCLGLLALHEAGHVLDHQGFGRPGEFSSLYDLRLEDWWQAVKASRAYLELERLLPILYRQGLLPTRWACYLGTPQELFARSYAQHIAQASGSAALASELLLAREHWYAPAPYVPEQWEEDDFAPISKALAELLASEIPFTAPPPVVEGFVFDLDLPQARQPLASRLEDEQAIEVMTTMAALVGRLPDGVVPSFAA